MRLETPSADTLVAAEDTTPGNRTGMYRFATPPGTLVLGESYELLVRTQDARALFFPGFAQALTVAAVDSNFYDYYRSGNDGATGTGLISRVEGGMGLLGAMVPVFQRTFEVTTNASDPIDGTWDRVDAAPYFAASMTLFLESAATEPDSRDGLSGSYIRVDDGGGALLGQRYGDSLRVQFLLNQIAADTAEFLRGRRSGDTITAVFSRGATALFARRRN